MPSNIVRAEVRCLFDGDSDWWATWSGNALDLWSIRRVTNEITSQGGKVWIFIPKTNTFYTPTEYPSVLWVRKGLEEVGANVPALCRLH